MRWKATKESSTSPNAQDVVDILVDTQTRTCRTSPIGDAEGGFCMTDLHAPFGIVDGIRSVGLAGLSVFLRQTDRSYKQAAGSHRGLAGSGGFSEKYDYVQKERTFGPGRDETTARSWCTFAWFDDKIRMWEEGKIVQDGSTLSLPGFLRMWEGGGRRCARERFYEIYSTEIKSYIDQGLLEDGWQHEPSDDMPYLIQSGPLAGDYAMAEVDSLISRLKTYMADHPAIERPSHDGQMGAAEESLACLETFKLEASFLQCYPLP